MSSNASEVDEKNKKALPSATRWEVDISAVTDRVSYLWYVMEKARLVLVREKRALATPLEVGSHESFTPVNTATKSVEGERDRLVLLTHAITALYYMRVCVSPAWMCSLSHVQCIFFKLYLVNYTCLCRPNNVLGGLSICLWVLPLTSSALPGAHLLRAQVGSVVVRFVEVTLLPLALLMEILQAVQHRVCLFLVILTCRRKKNKQS